MSKSTKILFATVRISGFLGRIAPEIKVIIPEGVVYSVVKRAAKAAIREELDRRFPVSAPDTTDSPAPID